MEQSSTLFSRKEGGRNRAAIAGLRAFTVALAATIFWQAPRWSYLVVVPGLVLLVWMVAADPRSGCRLDPKRALMM